jgi:hypothetical protein
MLVTSRDRIQTLVKEGKTEQEAMSAKPLADLDANRRRGILKSFRISDNERLPRGEPCCP